LVLQKGQTASPGALATRHAGHCQLAAGTWLALPPHWARGGPEEEAVVEAGVLGEPPLAPATGTCTFKHAVLETAGVLVEGVATGLRAGSWDMGGGR
jgi:hypothetical protein